MSLPPPQPLDTFPCNPDSSPSHFIVEQFTPTAITATLPVVVTIPSNGFVNGQRIRASRFVTFPLALATGMEQLNNRLFVVQNCTTNTCSLYDAYGAAVDGTSFTAFTGNGNPQFTLTGPSLNIQNPAPLGIYNLT